MLFTSCFNNVKSTGQLWEFQLNYVNLLQNYFQKVTINTTYSTTCVEMWIYM